MYFKEISRRRSLSGLLSIFWSQTFSEASRSFGIVIFWDDFQKGAAEKTLLYFWFVLEMSSKTKSKSSLTHNVNDLIGDTIHFWLFSESVSNSWMFHPRIMFNVTEAKGEPRSKASYHALCFQFSIFRECYNESLLTISQQGAVDVQPNLFRRPSEDVVSFSLLIPPSLFFCLPLVPEKSFCLLGFAYDKS